MQAQALLDYLYAAPATRTLAEELAEALVLRRSRAGEPTIVKTSDPRRIAS